MLTTALVAVLGFVPMAFASGAGVSGRMLATRPDVARRLAGAWGKAIEAIRTDSAARTVLTSHLNTPAELAAEMPLQAFTLARDHGADLAAEGGDLALETPHGAV